MSENKNSLNKIIIILVAAFLAVIVFLVIRSLLNTWEQSGQLQAGVLTQSRISDLLDLNVEQQEIITVNNNQFSGDIKYTPSLETEANYISLILENLAVAEAVEVNGVNFDLFMHENLSVNQFAVLEARYRIYEIGDMRVSGSNIYLGVESLPSLQSPLKFSQDLAQSILLVQLFRATDIARFSEQTITYNLHDNETISQYFSHLGAGQLANWSLPYPSKASEFQPAGSSCLNPRLAAELFLCELHLFQAAQLPGARISSEILPPASLRQTDLLNLIDYSKIYSSLGIVPPELANSYLAELNLRTTDLAYENWAFEPDINSRINAPLIASSISDNYLNMNQNKLNQLLAKLDQDFNQSEPQIIERADQFNSAQLLYQFSSETEFSDITVSLRLLDTSELNVDCLVSEGNEFCVDASIMKNSGYYANIIIEQRSKYIF